MKKYLLIGVVAALLISTVFACAPKPTSSPIPAPKPISGPGPASLGSSVTPSNQDAAWNRIVEAAKKEGKLTIYSFNLVGDIGITVGRAFKDAYGISLDIVTGRGAEFTERVKTEKRIGGLVADITEGNVSNIQNMKMEGLTTSYASDLPVLREKDVWVADILSMDPQDKHIIVFSFTIYSPYVNNNLVKPSEEPTTWKELLDPRWKGKMLLVEYTTSPGTIQQLAPLLREKVIDEEYLKALFKQDLRFTTNLPEAATLLARGERHLSIYASATFARFVADGAPIRAVELKDGTVLSVITMAPFGGGPHPNATKVFMNWFLSKEGQSVYSKAASGSPARKDVPSSLPKASQITPQRPIILTREDTDEAARLFRERWLNKLWGR